MKTGKDVEKLMGRKWATWGEFKHALVKAKIIPTFYADCPAEWRHAYVKFSRRGSFNKEDTQIILSNLIEDVISKNQKNRIEAAKDRLMIAKKAVGRTTTDKQRKDAQYRVQRYEKKLKAAKLNRPYDPEKQNPTHNAAKKSKPRADI